MRRVRRIGAYGLCLAEGRVLLVRGSPDSPVPGVWQVPGGTLEHGEHPEAALRREFAEETGLTIEVTGLRAALAEVRQLPEAGLEVHVDRVIYTVRPTGGVLRAEAVGTTDRVGWLPLARLPELALMPFTAELLGQEVVALPRPLTGPLPTELARESAGPARSAAVDAARRRQRFAAYGLVTDVTRRVLLTRIAPGYPGAGRWHLPGGGTDHGEQPETGLLRELVEETGQLGRVTGLLSVSNLHNRAALGPEGFPIDWHGVRVIYRVRVDAPTEPLVTETSGSTDGAAWYGLPTALGLPLTEVAMTALAFLTSANNGEMTEVDSSGTIDPA